MVRYCLLHLYSFSYFALTMHSVNLRIYLYIFLPSLTLQSARNLNVPCRPKRSKVLLLSYTFKCPVKKTQSFCPCSRALNRSGKGIYCSVQELRFLSLWRLTWIISKSYYFHVLVIKWIVNVVRRYARASVTGRLKDARLKTSHLPSIIVNARHGSGRIFST
jgi:hypothetical protein